MLSSSMLSSALLQLFVAIASPQCCPIRSSDGSIDLEIAGSAAEFYFMWLRCLVTTDTATPSDRLFLSFVITRLWKRVKACCGSQLQWTRTFEELQKLYEGNQTAKIGMQIRAKCGGACVQGKPTLCPSEFHAS